MPALLVDENLATRIPEDLRQLGLQATNVQDAGLLKVVDEDLLLYMSQHGWTFVTGDRDFISLHGAWCKWASAWNVQPPPEHAGILLIEQQKLPVDQIGAHLHQFLQTNPQLVNALYRWTAQDGWQLIT